MAGPAGLVTLANLRNSEAMEKRHMIVLLVLAALLAAVWGLHAWFSLWGEFL